MRVLEILNSYPGETFLQQHAQAIAENTAIELSWAFCQTNLIGELNEPIKGLKNCIALINPNRISYLNKVVNKVKYFNDAKSYTKQFKAQIKKVNPDLIHFQFASLAARHLDVVSQLRIPFTFSARGSDLQNDPIQLGEVYVQQLKRVANQASAIHTVTNDLKKILFKYCGENNKTHVIRTCISSEWQSLPRAPMENIGVAVGRLNWRKGFPDLLVACKILKTEGLKFQLIIIGEGAQRPLLEFMIGDLDLMDSVVLAGQKNHIDISTYFSKASVFILSSVQEGFPNVMAEAMLAGVPVVSTALPGVCEVVEDGITADLAEVGNPQSLAQAIIRTLTIDNLQSRVSQAQKLAVATFSSKPHAKKFQEFWEQAIQNA